MKFSALLLSAVTGSMLLIPVTTTHATEAVVKAASKNDLIEMSAEVHKQMQPGGRFEFVSSAERGVVDAKLGDMQALFDKYGAVASMSQDSKIQMFNDQEAVNAILTNRDNDRKICKSVAPTGSLLPKTVCHTYGEIEKSRRENLEYMQQHSLSPQLQRGG